MRQKEATEGYVSIPTGHDGTTPTFMTGYWDGELDEKGFAIVEFSTGKCGVNPSAMLKATDDEITEATGHFVFHGGSKI